LGVLAENTPTALHNHCVVVRTLLNLIDLIQEKLTMIDSILFWNAVALEANRVSHSDPDKREQNGPTLSSRALAIVHLAMYDAYAGVVNDEATFPRYLTAPPPPPPPGSSHQNAVAGAAYTTLVALYKTQKDFFEAQLNCFDTLNASFGFGVAVGNALLTLRANDMDARDCGYMVSLNRGRHRVDPDNPEQGFYSPYYGAQLKGFAFSRRHGLNRPPFDNGTNDDYLLALKDVRARGIRPDLTATLPDPLFVKRRSGLDTLKGIYWSYDGSNRLGTPPRQYNQIIRLVAARKGNTEGQNARLFAFVNAAMGDAGILAWEQKYCHDFWRPVLGIREHDETLGPRAPHPGLSVNFNDGDPGWLPLGAQSTNAPDMKNFTPNFPAYPSGHATLGAAAFHITRMFYGIHPDDKSDDTLFIGAAVSDEFNGGNRDNNGTVRPRHTRLFPGGLWNMIIENATSRVLLGVHWIFDAFDFNDDGDGNLVPDLTDENIGGVGLGLRIARDIFAFGNGLAPKMTPNTPAANPPITTPAPNSPMPTMPRQPASVGGCANTIAAPAVGTTSADAGEGEMVKDVYPSGTSPR
jgi:vanadium chloroperoxidase